MKRNTWWIAALIAMMALPTLTGCRQGQDEGAIASADGSSARAPSFTLPSGTHLTVRLATTVSSETARVGDTWSGIVVNPVRAGGREKIPAGAEVRGTVTGALEAKRGSRAMLDVAVEEVVVDGRSVSLLAVTEPVIAGSPRARNLGAIAGGAAAGALIGKAVGGDGKDAAIGGLLGGATATGIVARSRGYQVVFTPKTVLVFTVNENVAMR
jgi:hypothetical protein